MAVDAAADEYGRTVPEPVPQGGLQQYWGVVRAAFRNDLSGPFAGQLLEAQRSIILSRTIVLIWISTIVMPTTIWSYVYFAKPTELMSAIWIVSAAIVAVMVLRLLVFKGVFDRHYHLSMLLLVAGVFGPTATAIVEITHDSQGDFFFAFFLIYFAFTALFPASVNWILATSAVLIIGWGTGRLVTEAGFDADQRFTENLIYLLQLTFIGVVLNRVVTRLFFAEQTAQVELRLARDSLQAEMDVAQQIQTVMLPRDPVLRDHSVHGLMIPADEVGGDYYDLIETKAGRSFVVIGDVSGHGLTSGLTMMMARASLLGVLEGDPQAPLQGLYNAVNRCLRQNLERMDLSLYMTLALFEYVGEGRFCGVGAHPPPMILRAATREVEEVDLQGAWLGVVDNITPDDIPLVELQLRPGDVMLMYTDGIVERTSSRDEMYGFTRLSETLKRLGTKEMSEIVLGLIRSMEKHSEDQDDDVTLVAIRYLG